MDGTGKKVRGVEVISVSAVMGRGGRVTILEG